MLADIYLCPWHDYHVTTLLQVPAIWLMQKIQHQQGLPSKWLPTIKVGSDHTLTQKLMVAVIVKSMLTK